MLNKFTTDIVTIFEDTVHFTVRYNIRKKEHLGPNMTFWKFHGLNLDKLKPLIKTLECGHEL